MKTIIAIANRLFYKLWVSPRTALIALLVICLFNNLFMFSAWVIIYALMYYGHEVHVAYKDYRNYSRFVPYAEADLRFKDATAPAFFKTLVICVAVLTGNFWLIPTCYLMTCDSSFFNTYINKGFRYVIVI